MSSQKAKHRSVRSTDYALLVLALAAVASAAILIRLADATALSVSFWRTAGGAIILAVPAWRHRQKVSPSQAIRIGLSGLALGAHFWMWLASLDQTTVAASTVLVTTSPLFIAVFRMVGGQRLGPTTLLALLAAFVGVAIIGGGDFIATDPIVSSGISNNSAGSQLWGDALALGGGLAAAIYLLLGESLTRELNNWVYSCATYTVSAIFLGIALTFSESGLSQLGSGYSTKTWLAIGAMILGPQIVGHTLVNYLLSVLGSLTVSMSLLLEPVVAGGLAWVLLAEPPNAQVWIGAPLVLTGVAMHLATTRDLDA